MRAFFYSLLGYFLTPLCIVLMGARREAEDADRGDPFLVRVRETARTETLDPSGHVGGGKSVRAAFEESRRQFGRPRFPLRVVPSSGPNQQREIDDVTS